ncbi:D-2-hydroxyacid dehydrogenase family protein [Glutamicibacter sp. MNS18]|uniref:D-2-hydroxyacid dehydrogenase family protein n=1 Tax=Glutamicibacter sp. MNS18 TaxID=2989817 RepID=UPI0022359AEF|nr:D-2-hydroxyacid dehydrogenase family protein [Glutamicibacter sp. MNS18]MCW4465816.1 D-2-hydroxyacid dehydrogenase family protein [Glutamicibacter sp. MNS18]
MRIAILDDYQNVALSLADWDSLNANTTVFTEYLGTDDDTICRVLEPFDVIVAMRERTPLTATRLQRLPNLRLLVSTGMRNSSIDLEAARSRNITVCGTNGSPTAAAEHTWALIMAAARRLDVELFSSAKPRAAGHPWQQTLGMGLHGKTLGIYGLGRLGSQVARLGQAFGMKVIAYSRNLTSEKAIEVGAELVGEKDLFTRSDVLSIHLKHSERTTNIIGRQQLGLMKPSSVLVNTSRSAIIERQGLIDSLHAGTPRLAAVDVFDNEPLPVNDALLSAPGVIATPHLGYVTEDQYRLFYADAVEAIKSWRDGNPVRVLG